MLEREFSGTPIDFIDGQTLSVAQDTSLLIKWKQVCRRIFIQNLTGDYMYIRLEADSVAATNFDVYLADGESFSISDLLISKVSIMAHEASGAIIDGAGKDTVVRGWGIPAS